MVLNIRSFALFLLLFTSLLATPASLALAPLEFTSEQQATAAEIVSALQRFHFRKQALDDDLSENFLDAYLQHLDPGKSFFLASDIDSFNKHRHQFDNDFQRGDLNKSFTIFERFRLRATEQLEQMAEILEDEETVIEFATEESFMIDREQALWPGSSEEADEFWRKRTKSDLLSLKLTGKSIAESRELLAKRYRGQARRINQQTSDDAFNTVINAFTMLFDPHTNYLSPRMLENFNINMSLSLEGIGAILQSEDEYTKVVRLVTAGPAHKQGQLKPADRIVAVGQGSEGEMVDVIGWRLDEVVDLIRGKKGTLVRLDVLPTNAPPGSATHQITIKRDEVKLEEQAVRKAVFELGDDEQSYKIGIIDIPTFYMDFEAYRQRDPNYRSTTRDVVKLLAELEAENVDGLIIDLRSNGGGSLQEATALTDLFIDPGPVVQIRQTNQLISRNYRSHSKAAYRGPLVVLINRLSASASEIFAGAIQDYGRGIIVGDQSFGKGTVQSLQPLKHGQLKVTESKFYRVSGDSTQHRGIVPDITLPSLIDPSEVDESSYDFALPWDSIHAVKHDVYYNISDILPKLMSRHEKRVTTDPDFIYLVRQQAMIDESTSRTSVSLRKQTRLQEQEEQEARILKYENARREAKGLEPYKSYSDINDTEGPAATEDAEHASTQAEIDPHNDPYLHESGMILGDFINLSRSESVPKIANFGQSSIEKSE